MAVTLFTKKGCVQCNATVRALGKKGVEYDSVDVTTSPLILEFLRDQVGAMQAPVVVVTDKPFVYAPSESADEDAKFDASGVVVQDDWSGFNPGKIDELV